MPLRRFACLVVAAATIFAAAACGVTGPDEGEMEAQLVKEGWDTASCERADFDAGDSWKTYRCRVITHEVGNPSKVSSFVKCFYKTEDATETNNLSC